MVAIFAIIFPHVLRGGGDGEASGLGNGGNVNVEPLAGKVVEVGLC